MLPICDGTKHGGGICQRDNRYCNPNEICQPLTLKTPGTPLVAMHIHATETQAINYMLSGDRKSFLTTVSEIERKSR